MVISPPALSRELFRELLTADLVIGGGGLAGVAAAITAARAGCRVVLIQDRPVLGGNASSEVRLWALGATSHMGNNNRWAREGGVIDEIFVENTFRNPEGNPHLFDAVVLDKVIAEKNIRLLLNTAIFETLKSDPDTIGAVRAFCSQNETIYEVSAPLFCDATGDGIIGFQAGAAFRMGAESQAEFGEKFAPDAAYGELLGHSIFFYSKNVGRPVEFVPPSFALTDITKIPRFGHISANDLGCAFWWLEYGGRLDTIHQTEEIKWELWKVVYGVWNYIKNSGKFPEAANLTLEWVGSIPGKRESRRFEGDLILTQQDVIEQRRHEDAVGYGGWAIDLHPADGVYSPNSGCTQWHSKGVYQIPYRSLYSRNIKNLFLAGRGISVSHVAFGSTRVMATTAHTGQAVGLAAAICRETGLQPRDLDAPEWMHELQTRLLRTGQHIPHVNHSDGANLAEQATATASSTAVLAALPGGAQRAELDCPRALLVPVSAGKMPRLTVWVDAASPTELEFQLRTSSREGNYTPDKTLSGKTQRVSAGSNVAVTVDFDIALEHAQYVFICVMPVTGVGMVLSDVRMTGVLALRHGANKKVAKTAVQNPVGDVGVDSFEFWIPERRPGGHNFAVRFDPPLVLYSPEASLHGPARPTTQTNAWVPALGDPAPTLTLSWSAPQTIRTVELSFDTDFDHAMESVQWGHADRRMPFCVRRYRLRDGHGALLAEVNDNHQTRNVLRLEPAVVTERLTLEIIPDGNGPLQAVFQVRCYAK